MRVIFILLNVGLFLATSSMGVVRSIPKKDNLIEAIIWVESKGDTLAYNKSEEALGCLQIRPIMLREVNRLLAKNSIKKVYTLKDRTSRSKSIEMFNVIRGHINNPTNERIARTWNGGYNYGESTLKYWNKVKSRL
jgi:hypothetical protein